MIKTALTTIVMFNAIATSTMTQALANPTLTPKTTATYQSPHLPISPSPHPPIFSSVANSNTNPTEEKKKPKPIVFTPPPVPDRGTPYGRQRGGASRSCRQTSNRDLTAIVPATNIDDNELVWGLTVAAYPSLWFYVPYTLEDNSEIEFVLQDASDRTIYQSTITPNTLPGMVEVTLPETIAPLAVGDRYHWYFLFYCDTDDPIFVEGWIERVPLSSELENQLQSATAAEKISIYAKNGLWYDTVTEFQQLLQTNPNSLSVRSDWESLLNSVGLESVVE